MSSNVQDRTISLEEYRFNEEEHIHELLENGIWKPLIGVSSVGKDITNFSMAAYYGARRALMHLGYDPKDAPNELNSFREKMLGLGTDEEVKELLKGAYKAHATYSKERAEKGTKSHDVIDQWIKRCISENNGLPIPSDEPKVKAFIQHTAKYQPKFIASEKHGYNKELWIGGIADVIVETNIGMGIWDNKDRAAIYDKDLIQFGGYTLLFPIHFTHVMGIPLESRDLQPRLFYDVQQLQEVFKNQLAVYKFMRSQEIIK